MMKRENLIWLGSLALLIGLPLAAHAAVSGLTPIIPGAGGLCSCNGTPASGSTQTFASAPDWGCVLQTIQSTINDLIYLATVVITLFIALAGFTYMTSGDSAEKRQLANKRILNAVIGLCIVLVAWLLVDSVMKVLYNPNAGSNNGPAWGPWNSILAGNKNDYCILERDPPKALPPISNPANATGGPAVAGAAPAASSAGTGSSGLNIAAAISYITANAKGLDQYTGECGVAVRKALFAGGLSKFGSGQGNAWQMGGALASSNFTVVYSGNYSASSATAFSYQAGDIAVFQPVTCGRKGHANGHITMYTGSQWVSDALQAHMASNEADYTNCSGSFTVYRP
jgi:hypothetical protein